MDEPIKFLDETIIKSRRADIALFLVSNFSKQVLELALNYAYYLATYGINITEKNETVVQQKEMLERAYTQGRNDEREAKRCIDCEAFNKSQLLVPQNEHMKWIPCSERLPEEDGDYLVFYEEGYREDYGFPKIGIAPYEVDCEGFGIWQEEFDLVSMGSLGTEFVEILVDAWMQLPEPYKGEEE